VVCQCVNPPYAQWPERFPLLRRAGWLQLGAPVRCWWRRTYAARAGGKAVPAGEKEERSWV